MSTEESWAEGDEPATRLLPALNSRVVAGNRESASGKSYGVVVVDDQKAFREVMVVAVGLEPDLEVLGEAGDGEEAIRIVSALQPDIVLLDIGMPVMDGLEALPLILEEAPGAQVVILTGFASNDLRTRALAAGACLFIEKGTNVFELIGQIKALCLLAPR